MSSSLLISYGVMAATLTTCDLLRNHLLPRLFLPDTVFFRAATDVFMAVELCATSFEMGAIIEHHGLAPWALGLFGLAFYQVLRWKHPFPCPYVHLLNFLSGLESATEAALRTGLLLASGLASFRLAKAIWSLGLSETHFGHGDRVDACALPWASVSTTASAAAEFAGTFALNLVPRLAFENPTLANNDPVYTAALVAAMVLATVFACLGFSGGMFNPMLATVLLGGCSGHDWWQHVLIYWGGATVGAVVAHMAYPTVRGIIYLDKKKEQ